MFTPGASNAHLNPFWRTAELDDGRIVSVRMQPNADERGRYLEMDRAEIDGRPLVDGDLTAEEYADVERQVLQ